MSTRHPSRDPVHLGELLDAAYDDIARLERAVRAADHEGVGVLVVRDQAGRLVLAAVCDDVPAGCLREADHPMVEPDAWPTDPTVALHALTARYAGLVQPRQPTAGADAVSAEVA